MDKQHKIEELEARIERLKQEKGYLQQWGALILQLEGFTDTDKVRTFDELYAQAHQYLQEYVEEEWEPKDGGHYLYEAVLSKMLGEEVWSIIRAIGM